jgi:hypothetical protein
MTSIRESVAAMPVGRRLTLFAGVAVAVLALLILGCATVLRFSGSGGAGARRSVPTRAAESQPPAAATGQLTSTIAPEQSADIANDIARIRAMPDVGPAASKRYPTISRDQRSQPDLYARAFVGELLTQDYRAPREQLLAWVQSEAALSSEPMVVGLVPVDLRSKLGLWSVTDAPDGSPTPIPSDSEWAAWGQRNAYTTVKILRVTEPAKWASAVAAGQLTDPGITSRDVDAEETTHWTDGKAKRESVQSVTLSINIEGPPSQTAFGFVDAVTYDAVAVN